MQNVSIVINKESRQVHLSKSVIGNDGENLQENLVFSFDDEFVNGTARLELITPDKEKSYIMLEKIDETYQLPVKSVITKVGRLNMQLVITEGTDDEEIPIFKSNKFYLVVNSSINAEIEEEPTYPEWIDIANSKLNELDNLDIDAEKVDHTATITITKKDGTETTVNIYDGEKGDTGDRGPAGPRGERGLKGDTGQNGRDATINGVNTLTLTAGDNITLSQSGSTLEISATGGSGETSDYTDLTNKPKINNVELNGNKTTSDLGLFNGNYNDLTNKPTIPVVPTNVSAFTNDAGYLTEHQDLTDYVKNIDYATTSKGGVVKSSGFGALVNQYGQLYAEAITYANYPDVTNWTFIGKQTLENVITGKGLVNSTDLATKLDTSKVKNAQSTTAGDVYDVTYINSTIGDIETLLGGI